MCTAVGLEVTTIMQEEANQKTVCLVVTATKMTGSVIAKGIDRYLQHRKTAKQLKQKDPSTYKMNQPKRVKVKTLVKEGAEVASIEIKDEKIKQFEKIAKKHGVRYAIKKDKSTSPPTYFIFFKGKDAEVINSALREFTKKQLTKGTKKPVIGDRLKKYKALSKET